MAQAHAQPPLAADPGSFRDPDSRVVAADGRLFRLLSADGLAAWRALAASPLFAELVGEGKLVATREAEEAPAEHPAVHAGVAGMLEHDVVPFVSYPYEWTFGMLRDAALLQLELLQRALRAGLTLKDASPYNVQFRGARPVFIDVGSFEPLREGEPWVGYRQFCMLFLYPLLLQAWRGVAFQPWLRGRIGGISPEECRRLLSWRDRLRRGALTHVTLHSRLERRYAASERDVGGELKRAGFGTELILANVRGLERMIRRLRSPGAASTWSGYELTTTYTEEDADRKLRFVRAAAEPLRPRLTWDLGCNEGRHSRAAAESSELVVAVDGDAVVVDRLYEELSAEGSTAILPLTLDLADPSPGLGWRGLERRPLPARGTPDLTLCLALVHHVSIAGNVPVREFLDWLHGLRTHLVIELPTEDDPMVQRLLARKRRGAHPDYRRDWFERCLAERFDVAASETLSSGTRVLYRASPRA